MPRGTSPASLARHKETDAALSAAREARIYLQHVEKNLKAPADVDAAIEELAAALSYVQIALKRLGEI